MMDLQVTQVPKDHLSHRPFAWLHNAFPSPQVIRECAERSLESIERCCNIFAQFSRGSARAHLDIPLPHARLRILLPHLTHVCTTEEPHEAVCLASQVGKDVSS